MAAEENKALTRRVIEEIFTEGNLDLADDLIAPDCVNHDPAMPEEVHGIEGFKELVRMYRSAFPDLHVESRIRSPRGTRWRHAGRPAVPTMGSLQASQPPATGWRSLGWRSVAFPVGRSRKSVLTPMIWG